MYNYSKLNKNQLISILHELDRHLTSEDKEKILSAFESANVEPSSSVIDGLEKEIEKKKALISEQEKELFTYRANNEHVQKLKYELQEKLSDLYWAPVKNERGAGRKPILTPKIIASIKALKKDGMTQRDIAKKMGYSLGLINKACNTP